MLKRHKFLFYLGLGVLILAFIYAVQYFFNKEGRSPVYGKASNSGFELLSPAFKEGSVIPVAYTCKGQNINPPLNILKKPEGTKSYVLIMHDPDAVSGDFIHWLMWDIPAVTTSVATNGVPVGAIQGPNGAGQNSYFGPCPPKGTGTHHYNFKLYALDSSLGLDSKSSRLDVENAMQEHILAQANLIGIVKAD